MTYVEILCTLPLVLPYVNILHNYSVKVMKLILGQSLHFIHISLVVHVCVAV